MDAVSGSSVLPWDLPWELLSKILVKLPLRSIAVSACVAKAWDDVVRNDRRLVNKLRSATKWRSKNVIPSTFELHKVFDDMPDMSMYLTARRGRCFAFVSGVYVGVVNLDNVGAHWKRDIQNDECFEVLEICFVDDVLMLGTREGTVFGLGILDGDQVFREQIFTDEMETTEFWKRIPRTPILAIVDLGDNIAFGGSNYVQIWKKEPLARHHVMGHAGDMLSLASVGEGAHLLSLSCEAMKLWDTRTGECLMSTTSSRHEFADMAECDGVIATTSRNGVLNLWRIGSFEAGSFDCVHTIRTHGSSMIGGFIEDRVVTWHNFCSLPHIEVWCTQDWELMHNFSKEARKGGVARQVWMDELSLVIACKSGKLFVWDFS